MQGGLREGIGKEAVGMMSQAIDAGWLAPGSASSAWAATEQSPL